MRSSVVMVSGVLALVASNAQSFTGAELRSQLKLLPEIESNRATKSDLAKVGHVLGYISGFSDAYLQEQSRAATLAQDDLTFCLPKEFSVSDLDQIVAKYLERHQQTFVDAAPASAILAAAFHEKFPCRKN